MGLALAKMFNKCNFKVTDTIAMKLMNSGKP
jgi:hypothetical protein